MTWHPVHGETVHPQVTRTMPARDVHIDASIAPMITDLWAAGIATLFSCGGGDFEPVSWHTPDLHLSSGYVLVDEAKVAEAEHIVARYRDVYDTDPWGERWVRIGFAPTTPKPS